MTTHDYYYYYDHHRHQFVAIHCKNYITYVDAAYCCIRSRMPIQPQPSQFILAWDRHRNMLDCMSRGLVAYPVVKGF